ncbi:hypothetical protein KZX46_00070 (plasmid) [Polymorphobacter sp. PAMC 29334]|uniref:hypothetical protein n=1 Tax=Polymorphobacter sp. PAMC 29334 TaxID=2862331 RepID=UPI001C764BC3|nr:hypothetical protein [Polymorphobacter sp. PAMC 29334]QYE33254.1 hypothetical protein KZX46_00070 [Polymorphobacter sp. PAMC 29334]
MIGTAAFTAMTVGAALVAFDSVRSLVDQWQSPAITVGAGAVFALPFAALFLAALAIATARSLPARQRPSEKMGRWTWATAAVALLSIIAALIASGLIGRTLEARGYKSCSSGSPIKLGIVHWQKDSLSCAA